MRYNKKRNTAFLYEALIRELSRAALKKQEDRKRKILEIIKENFNKNSILYKELKLYRSLYEEKGLAETMSEKILFEVKRLYSFLNQEEIFSQQTKLIKKINKEVGPKVFSNFIPNYRYIASINQIFSDGTPVKNRIILEQKIIKNMSFEKGREERLIPPSRLVFRLFMENYNKSYGDKLLNEQKDLLNYYILSDITDDLELKVFINEEIERIRSVLNEAGFLEEIRENEDMKNKNKKALEKLKTFKDRTVDHVFISDLLKFQKLASEIIN